LNSKKLKKCTHALIAKTCHAAGDTVKQNADSYCKGPDSVGSTSCMCNGQYIGSYCDVVHGSDNSCEVTSGYFYYGGCDGNTMAPTPAPSAVCQKVCYGVSTADVLKTKGECRDSRLDKICLKSKLTAKMNADLDCKSGQCSCQGAYTGTRCFSIPVNEGSTDSNLTPYCYYFAKHKYEGYCASNNPWTASPSVRMTASPTVDSTSVYPALDDTTIRQARNAWLANKDAATEMYGPIADWNTAYVTNMESLFDNFYYSVDTFNEDLSRWDTSRVTTMKYMFWYAYAFNADVSSWDVSYVSDMSYMFYYASSFNQILCWNTSSVLYSSSMFYGSQSSFDATPFPDCLI
jgi:surface protein